MSKKLLNEAEMRRFMGLAGIQPNVISSRLTEMSAYHEEDEDPTDAASWIGCARRRCRRTPRARS